jgi:predicted phosphohydrolase
VRVCEARRLLKATKFRRANRRAHVFTLAAFANYKQRALANREYQHVSKSVERTQLFSFNEVSVVVGRVRRSNFLKLYRRLSRADKLVAVEVDHMIGMLHYPDFCFPSQIGSMSLELCEIGES